MTSPEVALQTALIAVLLGDTGLKALVVDRVFDQVPADNEPAVAPYVYLGPVNLTPIDLGCATAWTVRMRFYAVSTKFGRVEAWNAAHAVIAALDKREVTLSDGWQAPDILRVSQAGDVTDPLDPKSVFVDVTTIVANA